MGLSIPLLVAAISVPKLLNGLGQERFGILAMAWGLIGYAGILDLGIGRALTQSISKKIGQNKKKLIPNLLATATTLTMAMGGLGCFIIVLITIIYGVEWIKKGSIPSDEVELCLLFLGFALPAQSMSATFKGVNEAFLNFRDINILRVCLGVLTFGGPYIALFYSNKLPLMIGVLVASRIAALFFYKYLAFKCLRSAGINRSEGVFSKYSARYLMKFGGWITASSIISPIMVQSDRFFIGATISASAVSIYVLPYEVVVQSLVLVGAMSSVMFPSLTKLIYEKPDQWLMYFNKWLGFVVVVMAIVCCFMYLILPLLLDVWISKNLDPLSVQVGQVLCLGVFFNSISSMYYSLYHARGLVGITAKAHLFELPIYVFLLIWLLSEFGVVGAAYAWSIRMLIDLIILLIFSGRVGWRIFK